MKKQITALTILLLCCQVVVAQVIASYSGSGGTSTSVTGVANETVTNLIATGFGSNTPCGSGGLSGLTANGYTVYAPTNPHVYFKITPNAGYMINVTGFSAGMRRSNSGISKVRFAYSLDNGATWINDGVDHAPNNGSCGSTAVSSWGGGALPTGITSTTNGILIALYPYAPISTGGVIQINTIVINGSVTLACTPPTAFAVTGGGSYCAGGAGVAIGLGGSQAGINYQLYNGAATVGSAVAGTGGAIGLGMQTAAGTYTVLATGAPGCTAAMTGSALISIDPLPAAIGGTLNVCEGSTTALSSTPSTGTWMSTNNAVATVAATGVVTGVMAGTTVISYTLPTSCAVAATVTVLSAPTAITGIGSACSGSGSTLSNSVAGGTWTSSNLSVATVDPSTGLVTGATAGTANVSYTLPSGCFVYTTYTVNAIPGAITGTTNICQGLSSSLSNSLPGGTWISSNSAIASVNIATGTLTGSSPGTSTITYTLPGSCVATASVNVNPAPSAISGPAAICSGSTATYTNTITGGTWASSNTLSATINASTGLANGLLLGTSVISYSTATCNPVLKTITVNPMAPNTGLTSMCVGSVTSLSNMNPGGTWTSGNTAVASVNSVTGMLSPTAPGTATISYTLPTSCVSTTTITVNSVVTPIAGASAVCEGLSTVLSNSSAGGTWSTMATGTISVHPTSGLVTGLVSGVAYVTYSLGAGCYTTFLINVGSAPAPAGAGAAVCIGNSITMTNAISGGVWSTSNPGIATINPSTGMLTGLFASTVTISYTTPSCNPATYIVTVDALPDTITGATNICQGTTTIFSSATPGGTWSSNNPDAVVDGAGVVTGMAASVHAIITYTIPSGCYVTRPVLIDPIPEPIVGPDSVCMVGTTLLSDITPGGIWSSNDAAIASINAFTGEVSGVVGGTVNISYTIISGCARVLPFRVIHALPASVTITESTSLELLCAGTPVTFTAHGVNGGTPLYQWQLFGVDIDTGTTFTYTPTHGDFITCYMIGSGICSAPYPAMDTVAINVYPVIAPHVDIVSYSPNPIQYLGQVVTLFSEVTDAGTSVNYQWYQNGEAIDGATNSTYAAEIYANDTFYCSVSGNAVCATGVTGRSNSIVVYGGWLEITNTATLPTNLQLYPNPGTGRFTISGTVNGSGNVGIEITDMLGRNMYKGLTTIKNGRIHAVTDLGGKLPAGSYTVKVSYANGNKVFHIVID